MTLGRAHSGASILVALAALAVGVVVRGDDVVVEDRPGGQPDRRMAPAVGAECDLEAIFDARAFGGPAASDELQIVVDGAEAGAAHSGPAEDEIARPLEPARRRAAARIATVDRVVGLSDAQRNKLEVAARSELRRLADAVAAARAKYAGRTLKVDPRMGLDERVRAEVQQAEEDADRCRRLIQAAGGPESLLARVVLGTLDEEQAGRYATVMRGRAVCRWRAVVAAGLVQIDEQVGFSQKQHDAVAALLLADVPPLKDDSRELAVPAGVAVAWRLAALGDETLAEVLDPRQRQVVSLFAEQGRMMDADPLVGEGGGMF